MKLITFLNRTEVYCKTCNKNLDIKDAIELHHEHNVIMKIKNKLLFVDIVTLILMFIGTIFLLIYVSFDFMKYVAKKYRTKYPLFTFKTAWNKDTNYKGMHDRKPLLNEHFKQWLDNQQYDIVLEVGCGNGEYLQYIPVDKKYLGIDINNAFCNNYNRPNCVFVNEDFMKFNFIVDNDNIVLFSHDVVDHVKDIDKFIEKALSISKQVYISSYRGFINDTDNHIVKWDKNDRCYYNYLSEKRIRKLFPQLQILKVESGYAKQDKNSFGRDALDGYSMVLIR